MENTAGGEHRRWRTPQVRDYFQKRLLRIYPGWIAALLFCVFVVGPVLRPSHALLLGNAGTLGFLSQLIGHDAGQLKLLPGISGAINGSTWTIPFELMCYIIVAVLGVLGLYRRPFLLLAFTLVLVFGISLWPVQALRHVFHPAFGVTQTPYYRFAFVANFLCGSLFFLFRDRIPHSRRLLAASMLLVGLTLGHLPFSGLLFVILPTFGFYILFYLALLPAGKLYDWAKHGDLSYGIYLYAYPFQRLLIAEQSRGYHLTPLTLFLLAWALACGAAALSWRFVERPFLRLKPRSFLPPMEEVGVPAVPATGAPSA